jgi:hypothetical protein
MGMAMVSTRGTLPYHIQQLSPFGMKGVGCDLNAGTDLA